MLRSMRNDVADAISVELYEMPFDALKTLDAPTADDIERCADVITQLVLNEWADA